MITAPAAIARDNLNLIRAHHIVGARDVAKANYGQFRAEVSTWAQGHFRLLWNRLAEYQDEMFIRELRKGRDREHITEHVESEQGALVGLQVVRELVSHGDFDIEDVTRHHTVHLITSRLAPGKHDDKDLDYLFAEETVDALRDIRSVIARGACAGVLYLSSTSMPLRSLLAEAKSQQPVSA